MIAADTSAWLDYFKGTESDAGKRLEAALRDGTLVMPLPVLFELLSGPGMISEAAALIRALPTLHMSEGFWRRAAETRRALLRRGRKARSMDCLIAQNCIDHEIVLIASDVDYRQFLGSGLRLA